MNQPDTPDYDVTLCRECGAPILVEYADSHDSLCKRCVMGTIDWFPRDLPGVIFIKRGPTHSTPEDDDLTGWL